MKTVKEVEMVSSGKNNSVPSVGNEQWKEYRLQLMGFRLGYWERASEVSVFKHRWSSGDTFLKQK